MKVLSLTVAVPSLSRPPPKLAELPVKVLPLTVTVPKLSLRGRRRVDGGVAGEGAAAHRRRPEVLLSRPPPSMLAELPVKVLPLTVTVPKLSRPPPPPKPVTELPVKVLPLTVAVPKLARPPPPWGKTPVAELPVKVLSRTVAVPPLSLARPPPMVAELPENTLSLTVNVPKLSMPPPLPLPALPPAIVRPEMAHGLAGFDLEDPGGVVAADGQLVGAGAVDRQVVRDVEFAAGQGDRAGQPRLEGDGVGAGVGVGLGDGVAQRAGGPVGQGRDVESRQDQAALQLFQGQAATGGASAGPPRGARLDLGGSECAESRRPMVQGTEHGVLLQ